jgi:hypothetical protein
MLQKEAKKRKYVLLGSKAKRLADKLLKEEHKKGRVKFKKTLNTVIGGATGIEVVGLESRSPQSVGNGLTKLTFVLQVKISDQYDFANVRKGHYDEFRKEMALLLKLNKFDEFESRVGVKLIVNHDKKWGDKGYLDEAAVFACFMYALEKRGWTPGSLPWNVTIPMTVSYIDKFRMPEVKD